MKEALEAAAVIYLIGGFATFIWLLCAYLDDGEKMPPVGYSIFFGLFILSGTIVFWPKIIMNKIDNEEKK